jgi:hypothetical protein
VCERLSTPKPIPIHLPLGKLAIPIRSVNNSIIIIRIFQTWAQGVDKICEHCAGYTESFPKDGMDSLFLVQKLAFIDFRLVLSFPVCCHLV